MANKIKCLMKISNSNTLMMYIMYKIDDGK